MRRQIVRSVLHRCDLNALNYFEAAAMDFGQWRTVF